MTMLAWRPMLLILMQVSAQGRGQEPIVAHPAAPADTAVAHLPASRMLPIPDRPEDPAAPQEGWCAETCLQMAFAYFGKEIPQKEINALGKPTTPDLHGGNVDTVLRALKVDFEPWDQADQPPEQYIQWIKGRIAQGYPVVTFIRMHSPAHPHAVGHHFVLAVGYDERGLFINTNNTRDGQFLVEYGKLASADNRYEFQNELNYYFGRAIQGFR